MKLVIDRPKWLRGEDSENGCNSYLLRGEDGKMCCLGFYMKAIGFDDWDILNMLQPSLLRGYEGPMVTKGRIPSDLCSRLMRYNDREDIVDDEREAEIKSLFSTIGVEVEFTG